VKSEVSLSDGSHNFGPRTSTDSSMWGSAMPLNRSRPSENARDQRDQLIISNLDVAGTMFEARFFFDTDTRLLRNIVLNLTDPDYTSRGQGCAPFDKLAAALMEQYGPPASTVFKKDGKKATWLYPSTTIYLSCTPMVNDFNAIRPMPGMSRSEPVPAQYIDTLIIDFVPPDKTTAKKP